MTALADVTAAARSYGLAVLGGFYPDTDDAAPAHCRTMLLLGPDGAGMWPVFLAAAEAEDNLPNPLDRWSKRVVGALADKFGGQAIFPSDQPYPPFIHWACQTGRFWASPVGLLVHDTQGLLASFRGALALPAILPLPDKRTVCPCDSCAGQPCRSACPTGALTGDGYDVDACHGWLSSTKGAACMAGGCAVRLSCPVGQGQRPEAQLAFHMAAFHTAGA